MWVSIYQTFNLRFFVKIGLFLSLNFGIVILALDNFVPSYGGWFDLRIKFVALFLSRLWFFRWCFMSVPGF